MERSTASGVILAASLVLCVSMALYTWTLAPTVTLVDSGALILAGAELGVAHPPGFPLYTMLAHVATHVPIGNIARRVHFLSALAAAAAATLTVLLLIELFRGANRSNDRSTKRKHRKPPSRPPVVLVASALAGGLLIASSRTLWSYATVAEVYTLNLCLIVSVFYLVFRWRNERMGRGAENPLPSRDSRLHLAAILFGMALGVHHVTVALTLPALAYVVYSSQGIEFFRSRRFIRCALLVLAGLSVYVYLPLAAVASPVLNWGDPSSIERFWWHVSGRQFQVYFSLSLERTIAQTGEFIRYLLREFGPAYFPLALFGAALGVVDIARRDSVILRFLVLVSAANLAYALNYEIAEDKDSYYLVTFLVISVLAAFGSARVLEICHRHSRPVMAAGLVLVLSLPLLSFASNLPFNNRSEYFIARDYAENILSTVEPGGMLLTLDWQVYSPMLYVREIERQRRDVVSLDVNLFRRDWYFQYVQSAFPETFDRSRLEAREFLEDLRGWQRDPDLYNTDTRLNERINSRFIRFILSLVDNHLATEKVYITLEFATARDPQYRELAQAISGRYQLVPQGLVFELTTERSFIEPATPVLVTRGLADGRLRFEKDDVVLRKVFPVYRTMLLNRGRYLAAHGHHHRAVRAYDEALALDPSYDAAIQSRATSVRLAQDASSSND